MTGIAVAPPVWVGVRWSDGQALENDFTCHNVDSSVCVVLRVCVSVHILCFLITRQKNCQPRQYRGSFPSSI